MIANFKAAAPPRVQEAVKRTVLRCIGSIQDSLVEDSHRTTGGCRTVWLDPPPSPPWLRFCGDD